MRAGDVIKLTANTEYQVALSVDARWQQALILNSEALSRPAV
jgi:hypothetical protein